jgi:8-hydroxy-5-deazaflavin:NADPH oxidoreductase
VNAHKELVMQIAIIGSGNVGRALAGSFTRAGHDVTLTASNPDHARDAAAQSGGRAAASNRDAAAAAELVVLAVHQPAVDGVLAELGDALAGKVVVDVTNRVDPANPGSTMDGTSAAEQIQARAPGARVVKAFNTAFASRQADPVVDGVALDAFIAGDDDQAKQAVAELAGAIGFRPIDAGPLVMARALEAMALLNITLQLRHNWPWQAGFKLVGPTA